MTARWLDRRQWKVAVLSALFSALAGITVAANLDVSCHWSIRSRRLVLTLLQKEARYGERAEIHRRKAEAYKSLIWDIEQKLPLRHQPGSDIEEWSKQWHAKFTIIEEEQQVIVPQSIIKKVETKLYPTAIFVTRAEELLRGCGTPPEA